ncbi:MAG: FtsX-like permease family protein, partial [Turicibacter sp.]|nr:FtsX-like permease family protein [Turicibacter sp.]
MKLTARLALSQLKVNKRRTTWTAVGIVLSTAMITTVYGLGFGSGIDMVDRLIGDAPFRAIYENTINGIAFLMSIIILTISVIVISNAFRVSAAERSRQFGILKSTGATKKQITATVVYEGIFLTVFAIPLGIVLGIFTQFLGVLLLEHFLFPLIENDPTFPYDYLVKFVFSTRAIWMSLLISASTVFISAWLPARKAAKIPAIDAIKGVGEVKIKNKKVRTSGLILKVFKLEGLLAAKFLKRSSRNFRATVVAMSFSIIIFIVAGGFLGQMERLSSLMWQDTDVNVRLSLWPDMTRSYLVDCEEEHHWSHEILDVEGNYIRTECFVSVRLDIDLRLDDMNEITERVRAELGKNDTLFVRGDVRATTPEQVRIDLRTLIDVSDWTPQMVEVMDEWYPMMRDGMADMGVQLVIIDEVSHRYFAELAGVGLEENILINASRYHFIDGRRIEFEPFRIIPQTLELPGFDWESGEEELSTVLEIHGALGVA